MGPMALRIAGLGQRLARLGFEVVDNGDLSVPTDGTTAERLLILAQAASAAVAASLNAGAIPVALGGDHSISMGTVAGSARAAQLRNQPFYVIWIDAHGDFNTPETSPTGNLHGMSLALLAGEPVLATTPDWFCAVDPGHIAILGARALDPGELDLLGQRGVEVIDMRRIDELGVVAPLRRFLRRVVAAKGHLHVSFDIDSLDPLVAPGVGTTVPGGLTFREAHLVMEMLADSGAVGSVDLVELNPFLDHAGKSADAMVDLTSSLFGQKIIARPPPGPGRRRS